MKCVALVSVAFLLTAGLRAADNEKRNVLIIMADDKCYA